MTRRALLAGAVALPACGWRPTRDPLRDAVGWLLAQQRADGAFPSVTTGFLRPGVTLTGLILGALCQARTAGAAVPDDAVARAGGFLIGSRAAFGGLGWGEVPEYPTYATALAVRALAAADAPGWRTEAAPMVDWLLAQQLTGERWADHPARGGFPMGSPTPRTPPDAGHVDLSMTRHALEALRVFGVGPEHPAWTEARRFVGACAGRDGGFRYAPAEAVVNKGEAPDAGYGTATADGVLALRAVGGGDPAERAGIVFLLERFGADHNPGLGGAFSGYATAMRFYWRAAAAAALVGEMGGWRKAIRDASADEQHPDGRWEGESGLQKENDPLVATALGVLAWCHARG